jgi:hypothetical protein
MIVFDLKCDNNHKFEAWFQSSSAYAEQKNKGIVECPFCGSSDIEKAIMAPNVGVKSNQKVASSSVLPHTPAEAHDLLPMTKSSADSSKTIRKSAHASKIASPEMAIKSSDAGISKELVEVAQEFTKAIKKHVEDNCDYVGKEFAEEARKIHYGETIERGIYGEASADETAELLDEGIDILPIPLSPKTNA